MDNMSATPPRLSHAGIFRFAIVVIALAMGLYHVGVIVFGSSEALTFRGMHVLFAMTLALLLYGTFAGKDGAPPKITDYLIAIVGIIPVLFIIWNQRYIEERTPFGIDPMTTTEIVMSIIMIAAVLEATRRVIGLALPITAVIFLAFAFYKFSSEPTRILEQVYLGTEGIFGIPISVSATYVLIFVLFGSFMERTGTGQLFMDFAMSLTGHTAGGPGKVSVVSSSLFGTISGSAVANVMVDGPISIPLMKRTGFPPHFAAGVEATASTGGQIMPPIMGAAAFLLAQNLQVGYSQVVVWALIPAILYYVACFCAVHFEAKRHRIFGVPRSELPRLPVVLVERRHLFVPVLIILIVMYSGYSAPLAALSGTVACFPMAWWGPRALLAYPILKILSVIAPPAIALLPSIPFLKNSFTDSFWGAIANLLGGLPSYTPFHPVIEAAIFAVVILAWHRAVRHKIVLLPVQAMPIVDAFVDGAKNALGVAMACACAGIVIGVVNLTGLGIDFTQYVVSLSKEYLLLALVATMIAAIVLGMGMPTTPAYIILTALLIPAIVKLGVQVEAAHMFALYFAVLSAITPPVALAVFAAAGIAKADLWRSGWAAVKVGAAGFVVPFMFVYEPALLMIHDSWIWIIWRFMLAFIGIAMLAGGLHGYFLSRASPWQRALLVGGGLLLVAPYLWTDVAGFVIAAFVLGVQWLERKRNPEVAART
jgi:TRAP transporter 4TM/12TM fusion protein